MTGFKNILLDLDGTLTDSFPGISASFTYALNALGVEISDRNELRRVIGPPLEESFMSFYGFDKEKADAAVKKYREYYRDRGIYENSLYPGVKEMLIQLKGDGRRVCLATSKPLPFAQRILSNFKVDTYFDLIAGSEFDGTRSAKEEVVQYIIDTLGLSLEDTLMVGDRQYDVYGAAACGIRCAGVLYGYGTCDELRSAGAYVLCRTPADVVDAARHGKP